MEGGWDPEVKRFFRKILNSISMGVLWMMAMVTIGLYYGFAVAGNKPVIVTILFYVFMTGTLFLLILYYYKIWKK